MIEKELKMKLKVCDSKGCVAVDDYIRFTYYRSIGVGPGGGRQGYEERDVAMSFEQAARLRDMLIEVLEQAAGKVDVAYLLSTVERIKSQLERMKQGDQK